MSVWERRDLPVLRAIASSEDAYIRDGFLTLGHGRAKETLQLDLEEGEIHDALLTLRDLAYVDFDVQYEMGPGAHFNHLAVTGRGQQALGEWPLFDQAISPATLALMLERLADEAATDEEASNMRKAAGYVRTLSVATLRAFATGAAAALLRHALGMP